MKILFTGDHHFNHENVVRYTNRPFADVEEMDAELISRWNEVVGPRDIVYHLGDFCLGSPLKAADYFEQLNGQIKVLGYPWHHDKRWLPTGSITDWQYVSRGGHIVEILLPMVVLEFKEFSPSRYPKPVVLCHYQIARWDRRHYDSWHLFGHSHGKVKGEG